jgi:hypothetical protein
MPTGLTKKVARRMEEARRYLNAHGCATLSALAKALGVTWERARHAAGLLEARGEVAVFVYGGKLLWCLNDDVAADAVYKLRLELWHVICKTKRRYISPAAAARLVAADARARREFSRFTSVAGITAGTLAFLDAALRDLLCEAFDRRGNKKIYMVPAGFCAKPPRRLAPKRYKPKRNIVTFKIPETMARDVEKAVAALGIGKAELVRMAVERLLNQYRHVVKI